MGNAGDQRRDRCQPGEPSLYCSNNEPHASILSNTLDTVKADLRDPRIWRPDRPMRALQMEVCGWSCDAAQTLFLPVYYGHTERR